MKKIKPGLLILVAYHTKEGDWRAFCSPFDVSCNAPSAKEAMGRLEGLIDLYVEGLEKYNYPEHLSIKQISDSEDRAVFGKVKKQLADKIKKKIIEDYSEYQRNKQVTFKKEGILSYAR